jgi:voltage-gated potassium channel
MTQGNGQDQQAPWRRRLYRVIFESDTRAGRLFDVTLIVCILTSVAVVMVDSVAPVRARYGRYLYGVEWFFTVLFTVEYILRLLCVGRPLRYAGSFFGVIDLLSVLPTYVSVLLPGSRYFIVIRILRVLRVFRVLRLAQYMGESRLLMQALRASRRKVAVFLVTVLTLVVVLGSLIYVVEGEEHGFTSIPKSIYWAVVTLTTVGYGDIAPQTPLGQFVAMIVMILGYGIIAVPTGIVTVEMSQAFRQKVSAVVCPACGTEGHDSDAVYCKRCGGKLGEG